MTPATDTDEVCIRVTLSGRHFLVRYEGTTPVSVAQEGAFGGELWRLPADSAALDGGYIREAVRAADAFLRRFQLPAVGL